MSNIWFTADTHFGHANIIKYCNRPFKTVEEMDEEIISEWQHKVEPDDIIYFLGDLTLDRNLDRVWKKYLKRLTGNIRIALGNHDKALVKLRNYYRDQIGCGAALVTNIKFLEPIDRLQGFYQFRYSSITCMMSHHPSDDWPGRATGRRGRGGPPLAGNWHLHGHSHGQAQQITGRLDVGWDTANRILSWQEVREMIKQQAEISDANQ